MSELDEKGTSCMKKVKKATHQAAFTNKQT